MKKFYTALLLALTTACFSQVTISENDFANAGDTVRISRVLPFNTNGLAYKHGGTDTIWDFSQLEPWRQQVDTCWPVYYTEPAYALYYGNVPLNPHRSNLAQRGQSNMANIPLSPVTISNVFNFFYKNNSRYAQKGIGQQINGIPTVTGYNSDDIVYTFPVEYGNTDTSTSGYSLFIPGMGYYEYTQTRTNKVDGWGTVITPLGSFQALRLVSKIVSSDSFYIDTLGFGLRRPQPARREYKWLANGWQAPVMQINATSTFGSNEAVNSIYYRDTVHTVTSVNEISRERIALFPNPAQNYFTVQGRGPLTIMDATGRIMWQGVLNNMPLTVYTAEWPRGLYMAVLSTNAGLSTSKIALQ